MSTLASLKQELRYANEGLAQMQEQGSGYFEDPSNPDRSEIDFYNRDVKQQIKSITALEKKIARLEQ